MTELDDTSLFQKTVMPHVDAGYNLARWLTRNADDAGDVVQEALLKAFKYFAGYRGGDSRSWFLTIVRNTSYTWLNRRPTANVELPPDDSLEAKSDEGSNPETMLLRSAHRQRVHQALGELPVEFREVVVLRELEGLSYKEISAVAGVPIGTVMSRLARARERLEQALGELRNVL